MKKMNLLYAALLSISLCGCATNAQSLVAQEVTALETIENRTYEETNATTIKNENGEVKITGSGATLSNQTITISQPGVYIVSGTYEGYKINVDVASKGDVQIVLEEANIASSQGPAIIVTEASNTILTLAEGTHNELSASGSDADGEDAALMSHDDLTIDGNGSLKIVANEKDGISANDNLTLANATLTIEAKDDGIVVNDVLTLANAKVTIVASGDGLKVGKTDGTSEGSITINGGEINIEAMDDGVQATGDVTMVEGSLSIVAGNGAPDVITTDAFANAMQGNQGMMPQMNDQQGMMPEMNGQQGTMPPQGMHPNGFGGRPEMNGQQPSFNNGEVPAESTTQAETSDTTDVAKGIVVDGSILIQGGTLNVDAADDALHANGKIQIDDGEIILESGDDAIHADTEIVVNDGTLKINHTKEGIESMLITINGGEIEIIASDDGINASNPDVTDAETSDGSQLVINGGNIQISSDADGIDLNGEGVMNGGTLVVYGPVNAGNGAIDYNSTFDINGGVALFGGSSGMAMAPSETSKNYAIMIGVTNQNAKLTIKDESGNEIVTYESLKSYQNLVVSSEKLEKGKTYHIYEDDTEVGEVTIQDAITYYNAMGGMNQAQGMFRR
ncbi:MAG: carbohydrate-binding domain-containing protein [Solobacterium sp.]|nr:carbohydrate-binding domain-containing protein [Solobacterium sp.]